MKKLFAPAALVLTASLLAGCASLLGPIGIGSDPLKLTDKQVSVPLAPKVTTGLTAQAGEVTQSGNGTKTFTFDDIDGSSFAGVGVPQKLAQLVGIKSAELVTTDATKPACGLADGFTAKVTINSFKLDVTEASSSKKFGAVTSGSFRITKAGSSFTITEDSPMSLGLSGDFSVLTTGGLNTGTLAFNVDVTNTPSNCTLNIKLKGGDATVSF